MAEKFVNKIARQIHSSPVSEEYDLAGYTQAQCEQLGEEVFAHTFRVPQQFRLSFIIGGGREVRQKYDANLTKWITDVLRSHGFEDDSGASTANDCQKKYKYQDDTGKNVKRMHVFPSSEILQDTTGGSTSQLSNEDKVIRVAPDAFPALLQEHAPTWLQHRRVQHVLTEFLARVNTIEQKMIKCEALTEEEAELYHSEYANTEVVNSKLDIVSTKMKHLVQSGQLTPGEKEHLIAQAQEKLLMMEEKLGLTGEEGENGGDPPAGIPDKAIEAMNKVKSRIEQLEGVQARDVPLREAANILKVWRAMKPLQNHDVSGPNKRRALDQLPILEEQVANLIQQSRDWFETDEELQERVSDLKRVFKGQGNAKKGGGGGASKKKGMSKKAQLRAARGI